MNTEPAQPQLFTQEEQQKIVSQSKDIFVASIHLTAEALSNRDSEEALRLAQISQIFGITLLGLPAQRKD